MLIIGYIFIGLIGICLVFPLIKMIIDKIKMIIDKRRINTEKIMEEGKIYMSNEKWALAIYEFTKVIKIDNDNYEALYSRGVTYLNCRNYNTAIADLTNAIEIIHKNGNKHDLIPITKMRGFAYYDSGEFKRAIEDLSEIVLYSPDYNVYSKLASAYFNENDIENAVKCYRKVYEFDTNDDNILGLLCSLYAKIGDYENAIEFCNKALKRNPQDFETYGIRGSIHGVTRSDWYG